jgi:multidrug/hemolysin transport system permease protein
MSRVAALVLRDLRVFRRNRAAVAFTVVTPVVLWILLILFHAPLTGSSLDQLGTYAAAARDGWLFASVAVLAGFSSSMGLFTGFVEDCQAHRFGAYLVSPVKRWQIVAAYLIAAVVLCVLVSGVVIVLAQLWAALAGQPLMSIVGWVRAVLAVALAGACFTGLNALAATFTLSRGAVGAYGVVGSILAGFLTLSYGVPQLLGWSTVVGLLPFAQAAALVRDPLLGATLDLFATRASPASVDTVTTLLGGGISFGGNPWAPWAIGLVLGAWSAILLGAGGLRMARLLREG